MYYLLYLYNKAALALLSKSVPHVQDAQKVITSGFNLLKWVFFGLLALIFLRFLTK